MTADESMIQVNKKTPGGEEIIKEVTCYLEQKLTEKLPEPPAAPKTAEPEPTALKEMVALATSCCQIGGKEASQESEGESSQTLFSYKKAEIKEISLTVENPSLEDVLLDYVRKSKGEIDLSRCSVDLKTSNEEIEKALESLGNKGKIRIELKTGD